MFAIPVQTRSTMVFALLLFLLPALAVAADPALERAATAMGASGLKSIRYSGDGIGYTFGQAYKPGLAWPKITVRSFVRSVNYETGAMRDEILFARAEGLGGGGYPHVAPQRNEQYVSGGFAWNQVANAPVAGPALRRRPDPSAVDHPAGRHQGGDQEQRDGAPGNSATARPMPPHRSRSPAGSRQWPSSAPTGSSIASNPSFPIRCWAIRRRSRPIPIIATSAG